MQDSLERYFSISSRNEDFPNLMVISKNNLIGGKITVLSDYDHTCLEIFELLQIYLFQTILIFLYFPAPLQLQVSYNLSLTNFPSSVFFFSFSSIRNSMDQG